jgi:hypothetical protein
MRESLRIWGGGPHDFSKPARQLGSVGSWGRARLPGQVGNKLVQPCDCSRRLAPTRSAIPDVFGRFVSSAYRDVAAFRGHRRLGASQDRRHVKCEIAPVQAEHCI